MNQGQGNNGAEEYTPGELRANYQSSRCDLRKVKLTPSLPSEILSDLENHRFDSPTRAVQLFRTNWHPPGSFPVEGFSFRKISQLCIGAREEVGFYLEICDDPPENKAWYPIKPGVGPLMSRIWLGQFYYRIPVDWLLTAEEVIETVRHYWETQGGMWPGLKWKEKSEVGWHFHLSPEDDVLNPEEPPKRPVSQQSPSREEVLRGLGMSPDDFW